MKNNLYKQATEQFKFNVAASADPAAAGLFSTIATIGGTAASFGMGAMMGGMGGGGRAPAMQSQQPATYAAGYPTTNATGTAPYAWGSYGG